MSKIIKGASIDADDNTITNLGTDEMSSAFLTGWNEANETWEFSSIDDPTGVITVPSDATDKYSAGMRISFVNSGNTIYGIITAVTSTSITFLHEIDPTDSQALHLMADSAITVPKFSTQKAPFGFPLDPDKWAIEVADTTARSKSSPTSDVWYYSDLGSNNISIPIGSWKVQHEVFARAAKSTSSVSIYTALSTSNNSVSDGELVAGLFGYADIISVLTIKKVITVSSKTTYYLISRTTASSVSSIEFINTIIGAKIRAVCAYL